LRSGITAAIGATARDGIVAVDVVFVQTPHRLRIRVDAVAGTFTADWVTVPGHTHLRLSELCSPGGADRG
jgi:hypothetical protein